VFVLNLLVLSLFQGRVNGVNTVSVLEMPQLQRNDNCVILDVNTSADFEKSHIPNSINFQIDDLSADNKNLLKHKDDTTVLVCQSGTRSVKAAKKLVELGFSNVTILRGGLMSWTKENLPVTSS